MLERFTRKARSVVDGAFGCAVDDGSPAIAPRHLATPRPSRVWASISTISFAGVEDPLIEGTFAALGLDAEMVTRTVATAQRRVG